MGVIVVINAQTFERDDDKHSPAIFEMARQVVCRYMATVYDSPLAKLWLARLKQRVG